ncbi:unnamed protein product, partial [Hapterophycus canaliculatus]
GKFWILDAEGLITEARGNSVEEATRRFARKATPPAGEGGGEGAWSSPTAQT